MERTHVERVKAFCFLVELYLLYAFTFVQAMSSLSTMLEAILESLKKCPFEQLDSVHPSPSKAVETQLNICIFRGVMKAA